jgi:DNA-binding HxlR family transcriptional regulator
MRAKSSNWKTGCFCWSGALGPRRDLEARHSVSSLERRMRFGELSRLLPNATQRTLTVQLRELEADNVITRRVYREVPPRVEYSLTELGKTLEPVLLTLRDWGDKYKFRRNTRE